jgi:molybdopterin-guanine dinucleotide biosynthesis protein A
MGTSKALLMVDGGPLIARVGAVLRPLFPALVVATNDQAIAEAAGVAAIPDIWPGKGPLAGIHAVLSHLQRPTFCVACDMPYLNPDFIRYLCAQLENYDAVVPRVESCSEPLHAVYSPSCLPLFESELQQPRARRFDAILQSLRVHYISAEEARRFDPELRMFENWNTPQDVERAQQRV